MKNKKGQSLLEVIIAVAVFGLVAATILNFTLGGSQTLLLGGQETKAESLAQQGIEAVRAIRDSAWNELVYSQKLDYFQILRPLTVLDISHFANGVYFVKLSNPDEVRMFKFVKY